MPGDLRALGFDHGLARIHHAERLVPQLTFRRDGLRIRRRSSSETAAASACAAFRSATPAFASLVSTASGKPASSIVGLYARSRVHSAKCSRNY